jgi:4-oxalmesaconate hydratase
VPIANAIEIGSLCLGVGFVGCNLNPIKWRRMWTGVPLTDRASVFEKMIELDVPDDPRFWVVQSNFHMTRGAHYINADTCVYAVFCKVICLQTS